MIQRQNLQFPEKDTALREDVHALGGLVGDVLRDQGGDRLFGLVEGDRVAAIERREGRAESGITLVARTAGRDAADARDLIRAFSTWFEVVNLAERVHRVRRRREYLAHSDRPQPGGIGDCMHRLKDAGYDAQKVLELLAGVTIYPVFTAHPTESTRRTMLRKHQQIADMMLERLDPTLTPFERRSVWERIRMEVTSGWQTESHPRERLTVADEREHALFYLAEVVYRVVPALYEEIALWMQTVFGLPPELGRMPLILRFGSWVGGDMDGNNEVHAKAIRETLHRQQQRVISAYFQECRALADKLSQSAGRVGASPELEARIAEYDILVPKAREFASTRHDRMPYRIFLAQVADRLRITYEGRPNHYESADQFVRDIQLVASSLRANHGRHAGLFPVERLLCRALTFGFHLATLDVRQHADVHRVVVAQGLDREDWAGIGAAGAQCRDVRVHFTRPRPGSGLRRRRAAHARRVRGDDAGALQVRRARDRGLRRERHRVRGRRALGAAARALGERDGPRNRAGAARRRAAARDGERARGRGRRAEVAARRAELSPPPRGARRPADRAARLFGKQPGDRHRGLAACDLPGAGRTDRRGGRVESGPRALLRPRRALEPRRRADRAAGGERTGRRNPRMAVRDRAGRGHRQQLRPAADCAQELREGGVRGRDGSHRIADGACARARAARAHGQRRLGKPQMLSAHWCTTSRDSCSSSAT